jgi:general secretion pathway protein K
MTHSSRQRGAAILTAMVIVTVVATLAAGMIWQQWRAVQVEAAERTRAQSAWILTGALDWARLILREDARTGGADHLGEPWAVPLAEARLSTFLAADRDRTEDAPEAFLAGSIEDAQARYNLRNLVEGGKVVPAELETLRRLFEMVQASPEGADRLASALHAAMVAGEPGRSAQGVPLLPQQTAQLRWLGLDADTLGKLQPFIVLLPAPTSVNLNTAPREVIAAVIAGLDLATAERVVQTRTRGPLRGVEEVTALLPDGVTLDTNRVNFASNFFEVRGRLRIDDRVLEERSLVQRRGVDIVPLSRERISSVE